ncbi:aryl-alcohol dehydrogenase-like predicted oxidoreductase [Dyadobacter sp. BE34]|uniref:Aryl-alcohol dehydrogenase-like predicted oxidoreductase n=1 Tax=Dyadobacter fermentans TaxID=94254 RepID=A0ABU1QV48_9BACT|nr:MULTISPECIES: aldo/keto reductase [Dyadobacter]MDR6805012.1 aryl-alcohol dehydrogenase-like predicted oxidoreductase [Dyadobacter fermentans]MDR7043229.1 aryl-alcohol dehydrogenase-like predicted oxidoreductase [Dyadobacter sp. BE242]MDR7197541.1 aryl-alcohol dehydrogenase-like predicted oxidoreductase [Dyadobacter sp. BE34]MDR7215026.1 aryl-alcohol dehydrogenase-like predicted oxidoreductase [Dyadobacter sp. BE31]MDR7262561.1 aryl-alcohol dehydrogenase-like predicted oxidoreductase [Dyadob
MTTITKMNLGQNGPLVSKLGLGCMRMSPVWGSQANDESESIATIQAALDNGINFLNTGDFYGAGHNELLVGKAIRGRRDDAFISVKFGAVFYNNQWLGLDLRPIAIKNFVNYSLVRLGIDTIDLYQPCRLDGSVPVEDVIGTVADLIAEGKVRHLGVSEITAAQLREAHSIHPVTALEIGYSLADRQIENDLLPTARELGIGVVTFANTAEGLLTGELKAPLPAGSYQNHFSRFQGENLTKNLATVEVLKQMATEKGYTPAQLAIAWVNAQGEHIMPLVSMSRRARLPENMEAMGITFTPAEMEVLNTHFAPGAIAGGTYLQR